MATLSSRRFTYDVFLSFRGEDTRYGFTGNLYRALCDRGLHTFIDDDKLQSGDEITPALLKAIEESRIAIVVLSHNYASSSFCLDELTTILHCQSEGLLVIPVFYKVDPSYVRHQKGTYEEALAKHQKRFKAQKEKLQKWKIALRQVADFSGYHFKDGHEYQYEFTERIVERVSREINRAPLHVADYPVGLLSQVLQVKKLLDVGSDDVVHMIGIHGMGGLGKTTLSLAVYNLIADDFDSSCFLQNVREESNQKHLQTVLLSELLGEKDINLASVQRGISVIQQRLGRKKVLLILDDVDNRKQLQAFAGRSDWFAPGSRVIVTTRDEQLLKCHEIERTYEVKELNKNDSLQLLIWNAFKREKVDPSYKDVLKRVVTYASGLPLALEVIGSNLVGKSVEEWESAIEHYKRIPNGEIIEILKVSFDALGEEEKNVFLDIACCLKGSSLKEVEQILGVLYDNNMKHHIGVLVKKSLIKVGRERFNVIEMHDLIEDMGRQIDLQKSPKEVGKRRRLWLGKDIIHVLKDNKGTSETEIICLDLSISEKEETIEWNANAFRRMKNLKILIIRNGKFYKGPNYFPESLRVLEWHGYPSNCLPSNFDPNKLVTCKLPHSYFTSFGFLGSSKKFENLTVLNFDRCKFLTQTPDMSDLGNLEEVSFKDCESLVEVHDSVGFMSKLKILNAEGCIKLMSFPPLNLPTLERLELSYCSNLEKFPEILGKMGNIRVLQLEELPIKELPLSFQNLIGLEDLFLSCEIVHLPSSIATMPNLFDFTVTNCKGWQWVKSEDAEDNVGSMVPSKVDWFSAFSCNLDDDFFSVGFMRLAQVRSLFLRNNNFTQLPECLKEFHNLCTLDVSHCKHLQEIRGFPPKLKLFKAINCISLTSSSLSMLLNKQLHEARKTEFWFPGASFPEWVDLQSSGPSCSFWFRNKFPAKVLSLLIAPVGDKDEFGFIRPMVFIDGKVQESRAFYFKEIERMFEFDQTYLFDLQKLPTYSNLFEQPLQKEWKHVKVTYEGVIESSIVKATGIHVFKKENSMMEDIRFDDPYTNNKLDKDLNASQSQNHLLRTIGFFMCKFFIGLFLFSCCAFIFYFIYRP
ncbi:TMV resistance protein N-like [Vigna umbellata]|uniref:TMV resistance protein N-like n=1 Tax=Vigna umbellata TaxID=87088 RepID=UPI001F5E5E60|nr:TMV resistance protein N-like [Vigna umbellata]